MPGSRTITCRPRLKPPIIPPDQAWRAHRDHRGADRAGLVQLALGSNRYQRVARFTDHLFSRIDKLHVAGFDPKWKTINLGATVPGLTRFPAAQEWLDREARKTSAKK